jgi:hypothetical protein
MKSVQFVLVVVEVAQRQVQYHQQVVLVEI